MDKAETRYVVPNMNMDLVHRKYKCQCFPYFDLLLKSSEFISSTEFEKKQESGCDLDEALSTL